VGLLVANHCWNHDEWQQLEIDLLKQLAAQLAIAIQQSLFEQAQTELAERKRKKKLREQAALQCCNRRDSRSRSREQNLILE